jgi:alpha-glucosidase
LPLAETDAVQNVDDIAERLPWLTLHVYAGTAISHLYEDAGEGWGHLAGAYRHTRFQTAWDGQRLTLRRVATGDFAPAYAGFRLIVHGLPAAPASIALDGAQFSGVYSGEPASLSLSAADFRELVISALPAQARQHPEEQQEAGCNPHRMPARPQDGAQHAP